MTTQYSNQFNITNIVGALTLLQNSNIFSGLVDADESGTLVPGNAVVLKDVASKVPKFELATAADDDIFGFIPSDIRVSEYVANEPIKVAFNDCVMVMEASAAIAKGAHLQFDPATNKVATKAGSNTTIGVALDKATADTDNVRVLIKTPRLVDVDLVGLTATVAEINAVCDKSVSVVNTVAATLALTALLHAERIVTVNKADGAAITLPAATGTGNKYTVIVATTVTSSAVTILAASVSDSFVGMAIGSDTDGEGATGYTWNADAADDTVTMTGTTNGGVAGDVFTFIDYATGLFLVEGRITQSGGSEVTPFSATVS